MDLVGAPFASQRDTIAQAIMQWPGATALGLPAQAVYQADTADSPSGRPFIVIRWLEVEQSVGGAYVTPFDLWGYDEPGDYNRITRLMHECGMYLSENVLQVPTLFGRLSQVEYRGLGADLYDDGWGAIVKPARMAAVGREA